jgi:hypothetical protein
MEDMLTIVADQLLCATTISEGEVLAVIARAVRRVGDHVTGDREAHGTVDIAITKEQRAVCL